VRSAGNDSLLHPRAYYTLIEIPGRVRPAPTARGRVLLLTQPQDFAGAFSKLEERIGEWLGGRCQLSTSQDLAQLDAGRLSDFDALIFFASGAVSLAASRQADLEAWLREGGALLCAQTDQGGLLDESPWRAPANADAKAWRADYGQGRVFSALLGDRPESWLNGGFQHQLTDALDWCLNGPDLEVAPPPGAVRLFAGGDLSGWRARGGGEPGWRLEDDFMEVTAGSGDLISKREFGDFLLHVEFMTPAAPPEVTGQARGNSGIYLQGRYEVQVLDSFGLDLQLGDCGAIYSKRIPDQNACRPPERWQTYDIRFRAARFDESGAKTENARLSAWHNGLLIHDQVEVDGPTAAALSQDEAARGPIQLQDHGNPVRYRNIWLLEEPD
jgi:hypothetical protein